MGIPMDDLHTPTVASGPTTDARTADEKYSKKLSLMELMDEKDRVESELKALGSVLDSHNVTMTTSLTTFDGYPRDDIDIAQIRTTRTRIIHLKNDYKSLMSRIEAGLHAHHASLQSQSQSASTTSTTQDPSLPHRSPAPPPAAQDPPFALVNSIVPSSPAAAAGLKPADQIRRFGHLNWMNHENLAQVGALVGRNEDHPIIVKVSRRSGTGGGDAEELTLTLTPRRDWGGRGLLGCHLLPI